MAYSMRFSFERNMTATEETPLLDKQETRSLCRAQKMGAASSLSFKMQFATKAMLKPKTDEWQQKPTATAIVCREHNLANIATSESNALINTHILVSYQNEMFGSVSQNCLHPLVSWHQRLLGTDRFADGNHQQVFWALSDN